MTHPSDQLQPADHLLAAAQRLVTELARRNWRLVLVESCTCGLVAATLGRIPGVSASLCGAFVVYRDDSKSRWLGVEAKLLADPQITAVSVPVARQMADGALARTPEADVAGSITGHLGPGVTAAEDGQVHLGLAVRDRQTLVVSDRLQSPPPCDVRDLPGRQVRQVEAALRLLDSLTEAVRHPAGSSSG